MFACFVLDFSIFSGVFTPTALTDHQYGKSYRFALLLTYFIFLLVFSSWCKVCGKSKEYANIELALLSNITMHLQKTQTLEKHQLASQKSFTPNQQESHSLWLQAKSKPFKCVFPSFFSRFWDGG